MIMKHFIFLPEKPDPYSGEYTLRHLELGMRAVRLELLGLQGGNAFTIWMTYVLSLIVVKHRLKRKITFTVELAQRSSRTIFKGKWTLLKSNTLITQFLKMSVRVLIGKGGGLKPFWTPQCKVNSERLWLPTETDCVDSHSSSLSGCLPEMGGNSLYSIEKITCPSTKNLPQISFPSSIYTPVGTWDADGIRNLKVRIHPTKRQKTVLRQWTGTCRYVYNKVLAYINEEKPKYVNFYKLRNAFVIAKGNDLEEWELKVPKEVRAYAVKELVTAHKACFTNKKNGNITKFKIGFRRKGISYPLTIQKQSICIQKNRTKTRIKIKVYTRTLGVLRVTQDKCFKNMKVIDKASKIYLERGRWYLSIPVTKTCKSISPKNEICALDPGIRKFQVVFSEKEVLKVKANSKVRDKYMAKLSLLQRLRSKGRLSKHRFKRHYSKVQRRLSNLVRDMHYKLISYLTSTYKTIFLPSFESQKLVKVVRGKKCRRILLGDNHYKFKERLKDKCKLLRDCQVIIVTEEYTSKTCGRCGELTDVGGSETFKCRLCDLTVDRDINGARNIFLKSI